MPSGLPGQSGYRSSSPSPSRPMDPYRRVRHLVTPSRPSTGATNGAAAYFMVNCAHPSHFSGVIGDADWARRSAGCAATRPECSHAELDEAEVLDDGDVMSWPTITAPSSRRCHG